MYVKLHTMESKGFSQAKAGVIAALREGRVQHEAREVADQKNLLAINKIDRDDAIALIQSTRGTQGKASPHHADASIEVWVFKPRDWYIKFYFTELCVFISFHRNEGSS